uniref:Rotatin N-terminal domain-containing protein n=1 Tax=Denticeps clupeoides TaxID=299321 RepID=A0AAY4AKU5_9TELE
MDLSALIRKTGHSLVEIRVRALRNIKSKLDHGLLGVPDLVQERQLFVLLLEWFNFPEVPEKEVVLDVLCSLSKVPRAHMLRDVGAVEFLTQLSPNVEEQLRGIIDSIFDQLFHLPETLPNCTPASNNELRGYFKKSGPVQTDIPPLRAAVNSTLRCLKFSTFPWLSLTPTDRHILSSNESSLRSNNQKLVWTTCELLCDVIMQDFPAEIFLQRPSIVQGLLSLLRFDAQNGSSYIAHRAVSCMRQLCTNLRSRLRFHRDPSFCSSKQDPISQNSSMSYSREVRGTQHSVASSTEECSPRPSVVGRTGQRVRGDGQDGDTVSSSGSSSQGAAPPRRPLQSPMDTAHLEGPELEGEDLLELQMQQWNLTQFCVATLEHTLPLLRTEFQRAVELLSETALLLGASVSEELWDDPSLFALELKERLQECLETLADILSYHSSRNTEQSESLIVHHRMAYMATAIFTIRLLQALFPGERAAENMPESVVAAIFQLCLDSPFSEAFPTIHETAVAYLEMTSSDSFDLFRRVTRAAHSLEATCAFLKEGEKNWLELLELGTYAVDGFPFHQHLPVVIECVQMCSYMWKFAQASPLLRKESQKIFLKLLAYPLLPVKAECYTCTLNLVKDSLGIQNVTRPVSSVSSGVHFVLHERVLYEICTFGLQDQVNSAAKDILLYLLKGRLMMTAETWSKFNEAIYPVIPVLQSYAGTEDALGNCILLISEASDEAGDWICPPVPFHPINSIKAVVQNDTIIHCLFKILLSPLCNQVESVNKLYGVLTSETVDLVLRRSAAEQLLVVLQGEKSAYNSTPCTPFQTDKQGHFTLVNLQSFFSYFDPSASLIIKESGQGDVSEAAALMCLLLFDEIARADVWSDHSGNIPVVSPFSLPASVIRRYSLPFQSASHHVVSPYCSVLAPYADLLTLRSAWEMLQVSWNRAWHSGIDHLVEHFHGDLHMSATQGVVLRTSDIRSGLQDCVQAILSAGSHAEVGIALARMKLYLLTDRLALKHTGHNSKATLQTLSWHPALERFLLVQPACSEDEKLLVEVVSFLNMFFSQNRSNSDSEDLRWTLELLLNQVSPNTLLNLVLRAESPARSQMPGELEEPQAPVARRLQRELTGLFNTLLLRLGFTCALETQLANRLLQCLRVSDAPHFYGLPSLERTLRAMAHVSALPGWSTHCPSLDPHMLCVKYLTGLLEVISSFYVEWGGNSMSFMGKGVTKNAVICLLHLSHEMMAESKDKDWMSLWSLPHEQSADEQSGAQLGLAWLVPLWVDRDPEVRCASLGVGSALSSVASGCQALSTSCQNISGGLWGTLLNILLEPQESSMVRREAAFILQNLLVMPMPANTEEAKNFAWQGPCVHDDTSGLALVGLPALQALLYHCQFFEHVAQMTRTCYLGRQVFSSSLPRISSGHGDLCVLLTVSPSQVQALLQYVGSFSKLLQGAVVLQPDIQLDFLQPLLAHVFILLTIKTSDLDAVTVGAVFHTWAGLFMLLATLLRRKSSAVFPSVSAAMGRHWQPFLGGAHSVSLCTSALHFLCVLLSVEAQRQEQEMTEPCPDPRSRLVQLLVGSPGEQLCELLLQVLRCTELHVLWPSENYKCNSCLLAGLIDSTVEQMKLWQTQLNLGSLRPGKPGHKKKVEDVKTAMEIVRNCLYQHNESKAAATDSRLASVIHSLWPWLLLDDDAMAAALELLCVYTANCSAACSSLCSGGSGASSGQAVARGHVSNSLMHAVMRLASQVASENSRVQAVAFSLLSNVAITRDGKGLLHKSNFLQHFLSLPLPRSGSKSPGPLVSLWLQLLLNMSFDEDGQQMIVKLNGSLELLVALAQYRRPSTKPVALLILHNICFSPANKAKVLASGKTVGLLASCLDSNLLEVRAVGASALWALLHNYQKAKVTLKDPSFRFKIDDVYAQKMHDPLNAYLFKCLEKLKQILSA